MVRTISRVTTIGARWPSTSTAPISRSASGSRSAIALRLEITVATRPAYCWSRSRSWSIAFDTTLLAAVLTRTDAAPGQRRFAVERLTQPNGFAGADGIFRLKTDGAIERGLAVIEVHPRASRIASPAPTSFEIPEN